MKKIAFFLLLFSQTIHTFDAWHYLQQLQTFASNKSATTQPTIALIYLEDPIDFKQRAIDLVAGAKNNNIHGFILVIDSPGGNGALFSMLHDLIKKITAIKPVITLIKGQALSGGYLLASATNYIIAHSLSDIGMLGSIIEVKRYKNPKAKKEDVEAALEVEIFKSNTYKTVFHNHEHALTDQEKSYIQQYIDTCNRAFMNLILHNRPQLKPEEESVWADGRRFIAPQALQFGLIDEIGTFFEAQTKIVDLVSKHYPHISFSGDPVFIGV